MADDDDIFASMGGSLLNDLLSDLDNTSTDDLFSSLEKELASSYGNNGDGGKKVSAPPGLGSAAAFVVNQQSHHQTIDTTTTTTAISDPEDAWSAALGQFGGMSLAADFLAADTAKKNQQSGGQPQPELLQTESGILGETISSNVVDALFENDDEEEYKLEEVVKVNPTKKNDGDGTGAQESNIDDGIDETGGLMALLGAASSRNNKKKTVVEENESKGATEAEQKTGGNDVLLSPKQQQQPQPQPSINTPDKSGTMAPPPSPMFPPPFPPGVMPPPHMVHPPPNMMHPPHPGMMMPPPPHPGMMMMPPPPPNMQGGMPPPHPGLMMPPIPQQPLPGGPPPGMMMGHPPPGGPGVLPPAQSSTAATKVDRKFNKDFPALGDAPEEKSQDDDDDDESEEEETTAATPSSVLPSPMMQSNNTNIRIIFNNADPSAPSIPAKSVSTPLMPQRDICYIIHSMLRPLQSLDTYNDDYYHWSFVDRKSRNLLLLGGAAPDASLAQPNPVWKEVKVMAKERETKFRSAVESRAKEFAQEKQSLGRMVKTNVNRPKALLNVPVMATMEDERGDNDDSDNVSSDKDYALEQRRNRVQLWKARMSIDKGYSAFLSLTELRRLIQANASQPQLVNELMGDVKTNVDQMHASLGVIVRVNPDGSRDSIIDESRLSSTLSLPKGRVLCARVIEGGILPHQSACEILPVAWKAIASKPPSSTMDDGEDRLLRALTGLVLTQQPSVDPSILCRCLDATISIGNDLSNITSSRVRMELLHSILSNGKTKCGQDSDLEGVWKEKETAFMQVLASVQQK